MCGIFGIFGNKDVIDLTYLGLHSLQHRGQESAGITCSDGNKLRTHRGMGLVVDVFDKKILSNLKGNLAIGHTRYSTAGDSDLNNTQPIAIHHSRGEMTIVHNGQLTNANELRSSLEKEGSIFTSNADSEVIVHLFAKTKNPKIIDRITTTLKQIKGAYSLLFLTERKLIATRDPYGFRPLCIGKIENQRSSFWVFSSESGIFDLIGAEYVRTVRPGELIIIDPKGFRSFQIQKQRKNKFCVFEHIYFARPDTVLGETSIYNSRKNLGKELAKEHPVNADIVIPVPDSGNPSALGYARESGIPFEMGLIRSHYSKRTFIEPEQSIRHLGVKLKLVPIKSLIKGKRVVVVDDSIVRGTTSRKIVSMLRSVGASEIHFRSSSPPIKCPCFYGIDIPTKQELIANNKSLKEIKEYIGCDSLGYLSLKGMLKSVGSDCSKTYCDACFTGNYIED